MDDLVGRYGELLLVVVGLVLLMTVAITDRNASFEAAGGGLMLVGVFGSRMEGPLKIRPWGLETVLRGRTAVEVTSGELDEGRNEVLEVGVDIQSQ